VKLPHAVTLDQVPGLLGQLEDWLTEQRDSRDGRLHVDASAMTEFDSSALALLLEAQRRLSAQGAQLCVESAPTKLRELAQLYGVSELLPFEAEVCAPGAST
jgi:phospholipid transport system transporter-binding protein